MEKSKEAPKINNTVMSLFRRKPRGKSLRKTRVSTVDFASGLFPISQAAPVAVPQAPRRRRRSTTSYTSGRSRLPMFRVT